MFVVWFEGCSVVHIHKHDQPVVRDLLLLCYAYKSHQLRSAVVTHDYGGTFVLHHVQVVISKKYYTKYLAVMKCRRSNLDAIVSPLTSESRVAITCTSATSFEVWKHHQRKKLDRCA